MGILECVLAVLEEVHRLFLHKATQEWEGKKLEAWGEGGYQGNGGGGENPSACHLQNSFLPEAAFSPIIFMVSVHLNFNRPRGLWAGLYLLLSQQQLL